MSGVGWMGDKWHCVHTAPTRAAGLSRGTTSEGGMTRSPPPSPPHTPPYPQRVKEAWHATAHTLTQAKPFLKENTPTPAVLPYSLPTEAG